jgi:hypothetical protein
LRHTLKGAPAFFFVIGMMMIVTPLMFLAANVVSWLIPPLRAANLKAMTGLQVSFWTMNRGLLLFGAVTIPLGLAFMALAALWRR